MTTKNFVKGNDGIVNTVERVRVSQELLDLYVIPLIQALGLDPNDVTRISVDALSGVDSEVRRVVTKERAQSWLAPGVSE